MKQANSFQNPRKSTDPAPASGGSKLSARLSVCMHCRLCNIVATFSHFKREQRGHPNRPLRGFAGSRLSSIQEGHRTAETAAPWGKSTFCSFSASCRPRRPTSTSGRGT